VPTRRWHPPRWNSSASGVLRPSDTSSSVSISSSLTYLQIKEKALAIRDLYSQHSVALPANCGLAELIANAIEVSDHWTLGRQEQISNERLFQMAQMDRIAEAMDPLREMADCGAYLEHMTGGNLNPFKRERTKSKHTLWELELLNTLRRGSLSAVLEEPDVVVELDGSKIGIACKKFYSTRHVQNVLSTGVAQIESAFEFGILAVNLDDLLPPDVVIRAPNHDALGQLLNNANFDFLRTHERHFRRYLSTGRLIGALVSMGGLADVFQDSPRLQTARQATVWVIPGLSPEKERVIHLLRDRMMN
jgi:hypothetical protein